jgi:hypothetical protein
MTEWNRLNTGYVSTYFSINFQNKLKDGRMAFYNTVIGFYDTELTRAEDGFVLGKKLHKLNPLEVDYPEDLSKYPQKWTI